MSLVSFKLDATTEVVGGWDPHDKEFVLYVFDLRPNAVTSMLWSNLCDYDPIDRTSIERLRDRLEKYLGMKAPEGFWERVERKEPERIRYEWSGGIWYRGLFQDKTFQVPMFDEPMEEGEPLQDSDIEVMDSAEFEARGPEEITAIRARGLIRLVG